MALDSVEGIREYAQALEDYDTGENPLVALKAKTLQSMLQTLLDEIDVLTEGKRPTGGVQREPLLKRRRVAKQGEDLV